MNRFTLGMMCFVLILPACSSKAPTPVETFPEPLPASEADVKTVAAGNNAFAFDLYRQLAKETDSKSNLLFSPLSIRASLAMAYGGARGETAKQLATGMHFEPESDQFHPAFAEFAKQISTMPRGGEFQLANAIWVDQRVSVLEPFRVLAGQYHRAAVRRSDFSKKKATRDEINGWVSEQTLGKIPEILPADGIGDNTLSYLVNALYFQANWATEFKKTRTENQEFFVEANQPLSIPTMNQLGDYRYAKIDNAEIIELPYVGDKHSLVIVLPEDHGKLSEIESKIADSETWFKSLRRQRISLSLPRFQIGGSFRFAPTLAKLKMPLPFSDKADFSGMGKPDVYIAEVYHQSLLILDESGSVAAAAVAIENVKKSEEAKPISVRVNRPFFVLLRDVNGPIIFIGRVVTPKE